MPPKLSRKLSRARVALNKRQGMFARVKWRLKPKKGRYNKLPIKVNKMDRTGYVGRRQAAVADKPFVELPLSLAAPMKKVLAAPLKKVLVGLRARKKMLGRIAPTMFTGRKLTRRPAVSGKSRKKPCKRIDKCNNPYRKVAPTNRCREMCARYKSYKVKKTGKTHLGKCKPRKCA